MKYYSKPPTWIPVNTSQHYLSRCIQTAVQHIQRLQQTLQQSLPAAVLQPRTMYYLDCYTLTTCMYMHTHSFKLRKLLVLIRAELHTAGFSILFSYCNDPCLCFLFVCLLILVLQLIRFVVVIVFVSLVVRFSCEGTVDKSRHARDKYYIESMNVFRTTKH